MSTSFDEAKVTQEKNTQTFKVLVADDDIPTRMLLRAAISQWGYEVVEANDGDEAWQILQAANAPRLLILDWLMPKMDGVTLCSKSRQELSFHPYIILLTQVTGITNLIKGLEAGADEFLSKPFNMAELKSRLSIGTRIIANEYRLTKMHEQILTRIQDLKKSLNPALQEVRKLIQTLAGNSSSAEALNKLQKDLEEIEKVIATMQQENPNESSQ